MRRRGLPPPTRGIRYDTSTYKGREWSTPAHAGNTGVGMSAAPMHEVYPRPRGEYMQLLSHPNTTQGLPPPTRGIRELGDEVFPYHRSTPAHAGNT